jgi:protein-S-isoprenylcysteine O-methyltransferase Ste14
MPPLKGKGKRAGSIARRERGIESSVLCSDGGAYSRLPAKPPLSCTVTWINYAGVAGLIVTLLVLSRSNLPITSIAIVAIAVTAMIIVVLENTFVGPRIAFRPITTDGYSAAPIGLPQRQRIALKLLGLSASIGGLALLYWLFPIYRATGAKHLVSLVEALWLPFLLFAPLYAWYVDHKSAAPEDGYVHVGLLCVGSWRLIDTGLLRQHCLQWLIKGFFLPLILGFFCNQLTWLTKHPFESEIWAFVTDPSAANWFRVSDFLVKFAIILDVALGSLGYLLTLKLLDAEVRSAEPKLFGWVVCLLCYPPFWGMLSQNYLKYGSGTTWDVWLADLPTLKVFWSIAILALTLLYLSATIQFGLRFSNLTHRGILTNGPYRWLKHPAYVAKNLNWWLISLPFLSTACIGESIRLSVLLIGVNAIYYLRARTEEAHLSVDPIYKEYLEFMRRNDLFAVARRALARKVPGLLRASRLGAPLLQSIVVPRRWR